MLNYSNSKRKDPHIKSYVYKCALTLAAIFLVAFLMNNYNEPILGGIGSFFTGLGNIISIAFTATVSFLKPMFNSIGYYLLWAFIFVWLWSLCVFTKIKKDCLESNTQWQKICHTIAILLVIYSVLYCSSIGQDGTNEQSKQALTAVIVFLLSVISNPFIALVAASRRDDETLRNQGK